MSSTEIVRLKNAVNDQDHVLGTTSAVVTIVEDGNFECVHCGAAYASIKEVRKLLCNELRFVFRHFPTVQTHPHALRAAEAAGTQGKFWEKHDELFTHQSGVSPNVYMTEQRIAKAKKLLSETDLRIADIALLSGFASQSHFSSTFRKLVWTTPKVFRDSR